MKSYWAISLCLLLSAITNVSLAGKGVQLANGVIIQDYYNPINVDYLDKVTGAHVNKAKRRYQKKKYNWVKTDLSYTLYRVPNHPEALLMLSQLSLNSAQNLVTSDQAIKYFEKAIEYTPLQTTTYLLYGIHLHKIKEYSKAIEQYKIAIQLNPNNVEAHYNLGLSYIATKNYNKAKYHAQKAYENNFPLNGLKNKLVNLKHWP